MTHSSATVAVRDAATDRLRQPARALLRTVVGHPREVGRKVWRLGRAFLQYGRRSRVEERLRRLQGLGYVERIPSRLQRFVGSIDMLRFFIIPAAADYYRARGINFAFHTLLRLLDDPESVIDPTGFNSAPDTIIGHLMQVVHANPEYDLQLLESFEGGLDALQQQLEAVIAGTHPRTASLLAIVEEPAYHRRLLSYVHAYRGDRSTPPLLRENIVAEPRLAEVERVFGSVPGATRYFCTLPTSVRGAVRHLMSGRLIAGSEQMPDEALGMGPSSSPEPTAAGCRVQRRFALPRARAFVPVTRTCSDRSHGQSNSEREVSEGAADARFWTLRSR